MYGWRDGHRRPPTADDARVAAVASRPRRGESAAVLGAMTSSGVDPGGGLLPGKTVATRHAGGARARAVRYATVGVGDASQQTGNDDDDDDGFIGAPIFFFFSFRS